MTVAVKYCGGCNPRFDRAAAVANLRAALPHAQFVRWCTAAPDHAVIICGCSACCADAAGLHAHCGISVVSTPGDLHPLIALLRAQSDCLTTPSPHSHR